MKSPILSCFFKAIFLHIVSIFKKTFDDTFRVQIQEKRNMIDIRVERLTKRFENVTALDDISFSVHSGELFFLLGPSGCGKTTLLRLLAGFYAPDEGRIFFGDKEISSLPPHKRGTGMVFQNYALWPHMTVAQNVAFGLQQKKLPADEIKAKVEEVLHSVRMEAYADRKPNELSGGQQQRVALARALAIHPKCLLLDEPLSNLDAKLRVEMRTEIRRICKEFKLTAIYVTHDQTEALSVGDRVAIFSKGHIEQIGTPLEVYKRPQNRFVAHFLGETNFIEGTVLPYRKPNADAAPYLRQGSTLVSLGETNSENSPEKLADEEDFSLDDLTVTAQSSEHKLAPEVLVRTALGDYRGVWHFDRPLPKVGENVTLSVRPEAIKLKPYGMTENSTDGIIGQTTYYGEVARYDFIKNDVTLKISELNPKHLDHALQRGLFANVKVDDVIVLQP